MLLIFLVSIPLYLCGAAYLQTDAYQNIRRGNWTDSFYRMPGAINIAVFGSSHGRAGFLYPPSDSSFFNFSLASQTAQYDWNMMREYENRFSPGTIIILTVSSLSPFWTDSEATFASKQARYYPILSPQNIEDADCFRWGKERFFPVLNKSLPELVKAFFYQTPAVPNYIEDVRGKVLKEEDIESERKRIMKNHISLISPVYPETNSVMMDSYREILSHCQESGWPVILVTPPYTDIYNSILETYDKDFYEVFSQAVTAMAEEYGVPYLDYSHDPDYTTSYDFFRDVDHLNIEGSKEFDARFFQDASTLLGEKFPFSTQLSDVPFGS